MERRIFIRDFRLQVSIGIHDFEKEGPQTVVVNVDLLLGGEDPAHNDRIANVLNYDVVHGGIMAVQAFNDPAEHGHLIGDVPVLFLAAIILGLLMPRDAQA